MARQRKEAYDLTDTEKRDLIQRKYSPTLMNRCGLQDTLGRLAGSPRFTLSPSPLL